MEQAVRQKTYSLGLGSNGVRAVALAFVILVPALSGCGEPAFQAQADETIPAGALLQNALANGLAWNGQARLVAITALEISATTNQTAQLDKARAASPEFAALVPGGDAKVGDGKARAWGFNFAAPSGRLVLVLAPSGEVTFRNELSGSATPGRDLSNFTIDSDQAAGLAVVENEAFAALQPRAVSASVLLLPSEDGLRSDWVLSIAAEEGGSVKSLILRVDARSGDVRLQGSSGNVTKAKPAPPPQEAGEVLGTVQPSTTASGEFKLNRDHAQLNLLLQQANPQPGNSISALITAPNGETVTLQPNTFLPIPIGTPSDDAQMTNATKGLYKVEVTLGTAALAQEYRFYWCTTEVGAGSNPACPGASS